MLHRTIVAVPAVMLMGLIAVGCASRHEEGVSSTYRSQKTLVYADTTTTAQAAEAVLNDYKLKEVKSEATAVDGKVTGKQADGTVVTVTVKKDEKTERGSNLWVTVGTLGDPALGAEIATNIKKRAEGK